MKQRQTLLAELLGPEEAARLAGTDLAALFGLHRTRNSFGIRDNPGRYGHPKLLAARDLYTLAMAERMAEAPVFSSPRLVQDFLVARLSGLDREVFAALWLTNRHHLIEFEELAFGTIDQAQVHSREVVKRALEQGAAAVVLCHNHPSGCPDPSTSDEVLTRHLKAAFDLIGVRVLDHVVVAGNKTVSMAEKGLI